MAERRQFPAEEKASLAEAAREGEPGRCPHCGGVQPVRTDEVCRHCGSPLGGAGSSVSQTSDRPLPETHSDEAREAWATLVMDTIQESSGYHRRKRIANRMFCLLALVPLAAFVYWLVWYPIWFLLSAE